MVYLRQNPTQEYLALAFSMSQGKVSQWTGLLLPLLEQALQRTRCLLAGQVLLMDATERQIPRSADWERQRHEYSGKQHTHTAKNLLLTEEGGKVLYLSATVEGSLHDKALADEMEMELEFAQEQALLPDLGFLGYKTGEAQLCLPVKKPCKGELTDFDRMYNRLLASLRVSVEHTVAGVKRIRITKEKIRLHGEQVRDSVMLIACGLHNLRIDHRKLS